MSDHVKPFRPELLRIGVHYQGSDATIVLQGELDTTGVERFVASVVNALDTHPESIAIDAHGLTFIDSSGLTALLRSRAAAGTAGVAFRISEQSPELQRAIAHAGIEDLLADE
jgi:anti-sigma B factor antagonist